ncbi:MAG: hypothetical protein AMJ60_01995 [Desulfobacterales bacterium SG8_35]|nr:MAG: hypothetical protein AMJ60_01995 [Desulfobacterales bacterium SG8_35]
MAERINQQTPITADEVLRTEIIVNQALIDILIAKQIISEEELVNSIRKIKLEQEQILKDSNKIISLKR